MGLSHSSHSVNTWIFPILLFFKFSTCKYTHIKERLNIFAKKEKKREQSGARMEAGDQVRGNFNNPWGHEVAGICWEWVRFWNYFKVEPMGFVERFSIGCGRKKRQEYSSVFGLSNAMNGVIFTKMWNGFVGRSVALFWCFKMKLHFEHISGGDVK